jgi:hypothetical protein
VDEGGRPSDGFGALIGRGLKATAARHPSWPAGSSADLLRSGAGSTLLSARIDNKTPSRRATSTRHGSRSAYPTSTPAWTACAAKTKHSPATSTPTRPRPRTLPPSTPSPISSAKSSRRATPTKPKPCCASSSPSCASTAATRSCPPTASAHPWFAHRQVQWSQPGSNSRGSLVMMPSTPIALSRSIMRASSTVHT